jgi:hypothetical protein
MERVDVRVEVVLDVAPPTIYTSPGAVTIGGGQLYVLTRDRLRSLPA